MTIARPIAPAAARREAPQPGRGLQLVAAAGLILASPLMLVTAALVRLDLGSPVFYRQARAGLDGRSFEILKFRSMRNLRDAAGRPLPDGARTTAVGRVIRRLRLDETPQLLAILRGDMGLVGPRPLLPATVAGFGESGRRRGAVRPGLTGWAQVSGNTLLDDAEKLALDIWYLDHRSPMLDARILLETAATLLFGERIRPERVAAAMAHLATLEASS